MRGGPEFGGQQGMRPGGFSGHRPPPHHGPGGMRGGPEFGGQQGMGPGGFGGHRPPPHHGPGGMRGGPDQGGYGRWDSHGQPPPPPGGAGFSGRRGPGPGGFGGHRPPPPEQVFADMDANGDGTLSREEFTQFHMQHRPPHGPGGQHRPDSQPDSNNEEVQTTKELP